ncbi:MAG: NADH-dependent [FeFe] hydrogenase, group A6 [Candidatus Margulisiibacteriota bacterium]
MMFNIEVNGRQVQAKTGETILIVLRRNGFNVPTLCYMEDFFPTGACRLCVVEVEGERALVTACSHLAREGMKIKTHSLRVLEARRTIIELLLASHPDDCLYCERNENCELQKLARDLDVRQRRQSGEKNRQNADVSSPAIVRDPSKCILCGRCVRVCEEVQGVSAIDFINRGSMATVGTAFDRGLNVSSCINCGQCIMVCPTGALKEKSSIKEVINALNDPQKIVVVQHAPAVSVTLGEELGIKAGTDVCGIMTAAMRQMGFDRVFDTSFTADLTIMEEASELVDRITNGGILPMLTSCSPGWIKYVEQFYPEFIANISTCKSPQQMLGAIIKSDYASREKIDPRNIFSVSVMPCTAKKFEAGRLEMIRDGIADIDAVLTTRELAEMIRFYGINVEGLRPEDGDNPFTSRSSAGKLFGVTGGVMEAAVRTAHFLITGEELAQPEIMPVRELKGIKEMRVKIAGLELGIAVVNGLENARKILKEIKDGRTDLHFIEVMTCPGGCIAGGGQPIGVNRDNVIARMKALYEIDAYAPIRTSHNNEAVKELYKNFLGKPLSGVSHKHLHTKYAQRDSVY